MSFYNCFFFNAFLKSSSFCYSASFTSVECVPPCHRFFNNVLVPTSPRTFNAAVIKEIKMLKAHLPSGIFVKSFDNRMVWILA